MPKIRAILFDKDGTLLDFNATWLEFIREIAGEAAGGKKNKARRLLETVGYDEASGMFQPNSAAAAGTSLDIMALLYPGLNSRALAKKAADADRRAAEVAQTRAVALPGITDAIGKLHQAGYGLGVATNDTTTAAEQTLLAFEIAHMFAATYGYDAVANPKPAPDVVLAFADRLAITPSQVAMVGDNVHDLQAGRAAGAGMTIGVLSGTGRQTDLEPLSDAVLPSIADLPAFLAGGDR